MALNDREHDPADDGDRQTSDRSINDVARLAGTTSRTLRHYDDIGVADMYVADPRFARNYGGQAGAEFVRAAMVSFARNQLG
jgi:hypothetical protein